MDFRFSGRSFIFLLFGELIFGFIDTYKLF